MCKVIWAIALTILTGVLFAVMYPVVRGPAGNSPNDKLGETIGTYLIPTVFVLVYGIGMYLEKRRRP